MNCLTISLYKIDLTFQTKAHHGSAPLAGRAFWVVAANADPNAAAVAATIPVSSVPVVSVTVKVP